MRSAIMEISILIAFFVVGWIIAGWNSFFYIGIGLIVFYNLIMIVYIVYKRAEISRLDLLLGVTAMAVWVVIAWAMIQEKQYHLWGLLQ
ncbi:MAG TPA: hypothetical protein PKV15_06140 [Syntrophomonadaceae bacterium]|nr:hypothetical protein [Syntrophomonadaceae bacterium]HRX22153.1 hypothetical protein [Syntrophomonadaceae bacterium]